MLIRYFQVWGMAPDLGLILAVMGTVWVGNPLSLDPSFSIAGESPAVENLLGDLFGILGMSSIAGTLQVIMDTKVSKASHAG